MYWKTAFINCHLNGLGSTSTEDLLIQSCLFTGEFTVPDNYGGVIAILNSWSHVPGFINTPIFNMGDSSAELLVRNWAGGFTLTNVSQNVPISIDIASGQIILDSSVTNGSIGIRGVGRLVNNSTGSAVINSEGLMSKQTIASGVWDEPIANHLDINTTGHQMYHSAYGGTVYIDTVNGSSGTTFPIGIRESPVNNINDAYTIASAHFFNKFNIAGSLTIDSTTDFAGYTFSADRSVGNTLTITSIGNSGVVYIEDLTVSGNITGGVRFTNCVIGDITGFDGGAKNCLLTGDITIIGSGANYLTDCDTYVIDESYKIINVGPRLLNIIRCRGSFEISNYTGNAALALDFVAGMCKITNDCTSGIIVVSGHTSLTDETDATGTTVIDATITERGIADKVWDEDLSTHTTGGSSGKAVKDIEKNTKLIPALV